MADAQETRNKILRHFEDKGWEIPDVASALNISEQYLRKILKYPDKHFKQITDIISRYRIR
ncbi:hypothetical protein JZO81_15420 [Enterococcus hulanensis]|uniref:hypothetical protein n=1 Tax=Enterococcus TaxID=1350 RepID=UPI000B5A3B35|nr:MULTISPECIES: hypothetical protein [Enterococcus]MBO0412458.1 hypothetical protein [Enterococcus hulanensis]OTO15157.1 hypothetical protein A5875_004314 [Enterococcus sp. 3H8_DIV0648]